MVKIRLLKPIIILSGDIMTNTISASLGLSVLAFLMLDYGFANSDNTLVIAQKFILLLEEIAIWR